MNAGLPNSSSATIAATVLCIPTSSRQSRQNASRTRSSIGHCGCPLCFTIRFLSSLMAPGKSLWTHDLTGYYSDVTPQQISILTCRAKACTCHYRLITNQRRPFEHRLRHAPRLVAICPATLATIIRLTPFLTAERLVRLLLLLPCEQTPLHVQCASVWDVVV